MSPIEQKSRLIYSTEKNVPPEISQDKSPMPPGDQTIYLRREVKGRGGKTVTTLSGLVMPAAGLEKLAGELKRICGSGGSVKEGIILVQGDHRAILKSVLEKKGFKVKLAGG